MSPPSIDPSLVHVVVPTYNERENLEKLHRRLRAVLPEVQLLIVDDNSPDGTGQLAEELAARDPRVRVLHRSGKNGLGAAYLDGFREALDAGAQVVVEMDADGSHQPEQLELLIAALEAGADLALGSRYVPGAELRNWPRRRELLSRAGNAYVRMLLRLPIADATGGYRAYRRGVLEALDLRSVTSQGYCFQVDMVLRSLRAGYRLTEVPITFVEREFGASKMSRAIVFEALRQVTTWAASERWRTLSGRR